MSTNKLQAYIIEKKCNSIRKKVAKGLISQEQAQILMQGAYEDTYQKNLWMAIEVAYEVLKHESVKQ